MPKGSSSSQYDHLKYLCQRRADGAPLQYLLKTQPFGDIEVLCGKGALIPRPETEELIELALPRIHDGDRIIDVGTGSGAIAITIAAERPHARVEGCDISEAALKVARFNNALADDRVTFFQSDLLAQATGAYAVIAANLPYVAAGFDISPYARQEPDLALFADDEGCLI